MYYLECIFISSLDWIAEASLSRGHGENRGDFEEVFVQNDDKTHLTVILFIIFLFFYQPIV